MTSDINDFLATVKALRDPKTGCPWDIKQTHASLASYCLEEAHEVVEALESGNTEHMMDELGDLLLQIVLHAQLLQEKGKGSFANIVQKINAKMIERHPHVFKRDSISATTAGEVLDQWNARKLSKSSSETPVADKLDQLPVQLPALHRAHRAGEVLRAVGFDWTSPSHVFDKVQEEVAELKEATQSGNAPHMKEELGDLLFVLTQWSRLSGFDAEQSLRDACRKFGKRVRVMEELALKNEKKKLSDLNLEAQEKLWEQAKAFIAENPQ